MKKIGIIGCGAITQNSYVKVLGMYHDVSTAYVFDLNEQLASNVAKILNAEVVSKDILILKSDIIIIATPPSSHFSLVKESLLKGKKVVCEKPFVGTKKDCVELIELAEKNGAELFVAHFRRCYPSVQMARSLIQTGILGKVTSISAYEGGRFSWQTKSGYVYTDPFGGVLFDTGSHTIDMALYAANLDGDPMEVTVTKINKDKKEPSHVIEALANLSINDRSVNFKLKLSRKEVLANKIKITCENGFIEIPAVLSNYIRIGNDVNSTVVYSNKEFKELNDCFAVQFKHMFYENKNSDFSAGKFVNLSAILENIAKD